MNIYVIAIGIECYEAKRSIDLVGPASDAVRFAAWFLKRGVPADNIHIFLSSKELDLRRAELDSIGEAGRQLKIRPATRDSIEGFFDKDLRSLKTSPKAQLFVLWGGHGAIRDGQDRFLYLANFSESGPYALNFDRRLAQLKSYSNLPNQHIFVDACANFMELSNLPKVVASDPIVGTPDATVTQDVVMAASTGQKAKNDNVERTGYFSRELFALLDKLSPGEWPAAEVLAPELRRVFKQKSQTDRSYSQRPVFLQYRPGKGGGFDLGTLPKTTDSLIKFVIAARSIFVFLLVVYLASGYICRIPGIENGCAALGVGGIPSPEERRAWTELSRGDCDSLRVFLKRFPAGVFAAEAQAHLAARKSEKVEHWIPEERTMKMVVVQTAMDPRQDKTAARAYALKVGAEDAHDLCRPYEKGEFQLRSHEAVPKKWDCPAGTEGVRCGFEGDAVCHVLRRELQEVERCETR